MDATSHHRFLGIHSSSSLTTIAANGDGNANGVELNEDEILWSNDFTDQKTDNSVSSSNISNTSYNQVTNNNQNIHPAVFHKGSGILAALPEPNNHTVLYRKPSLPSRTTPFIPRPPHAMEREFTSQSLPIGEKLNQSAAMNVPLFSIAMAKQRNSKFKEEDDGDFDGDEEILPPHEIVARGLRRSPKTAFSVLEGVGRTLKGRDLRQVRNAVWRQTGFLD